MPKFVSKCLVLDTNVSDGLSHYSERALRLLHLDRHKIYSCNHPLHKDVEYLRVYAYKVIEVLPLKQHKSGISNGNNVTLDNDERLDAANAVLSPTSGVERMGGGREVRSGRYVSKSGILRG